MRIHALLSWYDEEPDQLAAAVLSLANLPVDRLVALDGAYALYPDGRPNSPAEQHQALLQAARQADIPTVETHAPATVWHGNEIEKRTKLFHLAEHGATPQTDWYYIADSDETIRHTPPDLRTRLATATFDVAGVTLYELGHALGPIVFDSFPKFFRAIPGLHCHLNHFTYRTPNGRKLWGHAERHRLEPRVDLADMTVDHHTQHRHPARRQAATAYYKARDDAEAEQMDSERFVIATGGPNNHQSVQTSTAPQSPARADRETSWV